MYIFYQRLHTEQIPYRRQPGHVGSDGPPETLRMSHGTFDSISAKAGKVSRVGYIVGFGISQSACKRGVRLRLGVESNGLSLNCHKIIESL